ncbi:MAG: PspC domain-containing protein [Psychroflexus sp.]|nr:PspC domain-containing protein [Psychroflexus sp.]MDN6310917.1 PspC domain-containing protein [Psychroflexus sp.]
MNKTINISLGNIFFHVDEHAFYKLERYLKDIKAYLANEESRDEIIQDIELRIAELFNELRENPTQVIRMYHVDEMIKIMGNPEDYQIDDQAPPKEKSKQDRQLYRDIDNQYIAGVSSGLAHYFSIDPLWARILFIIIGVSTLGTTVLVYIILWILIPPALTTAEKLAMRGEKINVSNIEKKVKENYEKFTNKFGDIDYEKYKEETQKSVEKASKGFVNFCSQFLDVILKILGLVFTIIGGLSLFSLIIALFSYTSMGLFEGLIIFDLPHNGMGVPHWFFASVIFIISAVPLFYLLILGLKLLIKNLKNLGSAFHIIVLTLWFAALITLIFLGARKSLNKPEEFKFVQLKETSYSAQDTLVVKMIQDFRYNENAMQSSHLKLTHDANDQEIATGSMIKFDFKSSDQQKVSIRIEKTIKTFNRKKAKEINDALNYQLSTDEKQLGFSNYYSIDPKYREADVQVRISIILPQQIHLTVKDNTSPYLSASKSPNTLKINHKEELIKLHKSNLKCISCNLKIENSGLKEEIEPRKDSLL